MFSIGSSAWPGVSKLIEEAGEVVQVCGKLLGANGAVDHWDGTNLRARLEEELADLQAAIHFVTRHCGLSDDRIRDRAERKLALFEEWHRSPVSLPAEVKP